MMMKKLVSALAVLLTASIAGATGIEPFQADFTVSRNGKDLGAMKMQLSKAAPGELLFVSRTEGTKGLASWLGVTIEERSELSLTEAGLSTRSYRYVQDMVGRHRERELKLLPEGKVSEKDGDKSWTYKADRAILDRHSVVLGIAAKLRAGVDAGAVFDLRVASKGLSENWRFLIVGDEEIETGNGTVATVRVERVRENSDRKTISWHALQYNYLPVKVEQVEPDGERLVSLLKHFAE